LLKEHDFTRINDPTFYLAFFMNGTDFFKHC
jgi:hypothetical protein